MADYATYTHTLLRPVEIDGKKVTTVILREPDCEALELLQESGVFATATDAASSAASEETAASGTEEAGSDEAAAAAPAPEFSIRQTRQLVEALIDGDRRVARKLFFADLTKLAEAAGPLVESGTASPD